MVSKSGTAARQAKRGSKGSMNGRLEHANELSSTNFAENKGASERR